MRIFHLGARGAAMAITGFGIGILILGSLLTKTVIEAPAWYTVTSYSPIQDTQQGRFGEVRIQADHDEAWYVNDELALLHMADDQLRALRLNMKIVCRKEYRVQTLTKARIIGSDERRCYIPSKRMLYARDSPGRFVIVLPNRAPRPPRSRFPFAHWHRRQ